MLKRSYVVLIAGSVLLIIGIIIVWAWMISFADQVLHENKIFDATIRPSDYGYLKLQINDTGRSISLVIPPPIYPALHNLHLENIIIVVKDPNHRIVILNQPNNLTNIMFKPNITGEYTLYILNRDSNSTSLYGVIFGYPPFIDEHNNLNFNLFNVIIVGTLLITLGIITIIVGIIYAILKRRRNFADSSRKLIK